MSVQADILLKGAWFSLEQCGHLLRNAVTLHAGKAYASSVALALLAREELGRYRILIELWRKAAGGAAVTVDEVRASCDDHEVKQREAQLSITYRAEGSGRFAELLRTRIQARPGTPEFRNADEQLKHLDEIKLKRTPGDRHSTRMKALYVDINDRGTDWNRPAAIPEGEATSCLLDAVNDYSVQANKLNEPGLLRELDAPFATALDAWQDKPLLPVPAWPEAAITGII